MKLYELKEDALRGYNDEQIKAFLEAIRLDPETKIFDQALVKDMRMVRGWLDSGVCQDWAQVSDRWQRYQSGELTDDPPLVLNLSGSQSQSDQPQPQSNVNGSVAIGVLGQTSEVVSQKTLEGMAEVAGTIPQKMSAALEYMTLQKVATSIESGELDRKISEFEHNGLGKGSSPLMREVDNILSGSQPKQIEGSPPQ